MPSGNYLRLRGRKHKWSLLVHHITRKAGYVAQKRKIINLIYISGKESCQKTTIWKITKELGWQYSLDLRGIGFEDGRWMELA
jgi:hypothetical protein